MPKIPSRVNFQRGRPTFRRKTTGPRSSKRLCEVYGEGCVMDVFETSENGAGNSRKCTTKRTKWKTVDFGRDCGKSRGRHGRPSGNSHRWSLRYPKTSKSTNRFRKKNWGIRKFVPMACRESFERYDGSGRRKCITLRRYRWDETWVYHL